LSACEKRRIPLWPFLPTPTTITPQFRRKTLVLAIIILPDPPELLIFGVFLGIRLSSRPVLTRLESPWRYVGYLHLENRGLKRLTNGLTLA